ASTCGCPHRREAVSSTASVHLSERHRRQQTRRMTASESAPSGATPLDRLLDPHDAASTALVFQGHAWTYADLGSMAGALSGGMAGLAGERVAFMLPTGPEAVTTYLACFRSGAVATPLNMRYAAPEVERALRRVRPRWLVVHESRLDRLER